MQLVLVVTTICAVFSSIDAFVPLSAYTKVAKYSAPSNSTTTEKAKVNSTDSPWEEQIVYGNNEVSTNKRVNDRFLEKVEKSEVPNNRNKRQPELVRLHSDSTQAKIAVENVESVLKHVEDVIKEYKKRGAKKEVKPTNMKMEHKEGSFELPPDKFEATRISRQSAFSSAQSSGSNNLSNPNLSNNNFNPSIQNNNFNPEGRIINRPQYQQTDLNSPSYNGFRPMTNIGNRLSNYISPNQNNPFVTGNPAPFSPPQQQYYYTPNQQPYAGNPYSPTDFAFPGQQNYNNYPQQQVNYPQQPTNFPQQQAYYPQQQPYYPRPQQYYQPQVHYHHPDHHKLVTIAIPLVQVHDPRSGRRVHNPAWDHRHTNPTVNVNVRGPVSVRTSTPVQVQRPILGAIADRIRAPQLPPPSRRPAELSVNIFRQK